MNIDEILSVLTDGDAEFMAELSEAYLENMVEFKEVGVVAVQNQDLEQYREIAHKVKPSLLTMERTEDVEKVETIRDNFKPELIEEHCKTIVEICDPLIEELQRISGSAAD